MKNLDKITVSGFKSIKELNDFELRQLNIIIGSNGVGKSNFINIFKLLYQIILRNLQTFVGKAGGAEKLLYYGSKITEEIFIKFLFGNNGYEVRLISTAEDKLLIEKEIVSFFNERRWTASHPFELKISTSVPESNLPESKEDVASYVRNIMTHWRVYHFHDTSESAKVKKLADIADNSMLRDDASNLASFLYLLKKRSRSDYQNIVEIVRLVFPLFDDFILRPYSLNPDKILLEWKEKGSDSYFNASALSDGTLRFICLAVLLLQPELPSLIIIDEPELGLHPHAIQVLAGLLESAAKKSQVIVSTQSVTLINQFQAEDIVVVERQNGETSFKRCSDQELEHWLTDYGLGELWEKNLLGGTPL